MSMLRILFLSAAIITVPLGAYLLNFRKSPEPIKDVVFVSAVETETPVAITTEQPVVKLAALNTQPDDSVFDLPSTNNATNTAKQQSMTSNVLAGLGAASRSPAKPAPTIAAPNTNKTDLQSLTDNVLASLNAGKTAPKKSNSKVSKLKDLIDRSLREGKSGEYVDALMEEYVDALVNEAYNGTAAIPEELVTPEGSVDTRALLATLVEQSDAAAGGGYVTMLNSAGATFNRPKPVKLKKAQFYIVKSGDSLAAISYQYYGRTAGYIKIFEANKDKLNSVNQIRVGQKLVIPVL